MYTVAYDDKSGDPISVLSNLRISIPLDERNGDFREFLAWNAQQPIPLDWHSTQPIPPERQREILSSAVQSHLDTTAMQREYDSADRCASFVNSTNAVWAAEATAFVAWRDTCWAAYIAAVASEPYPTPAELVASLPEITWPQ